MMDDSKIDIYIQAANQALLKNTGKYLTDVERFVLENTLRSLSYKEMQNKNDFWSLNYIQNFASPKLWEKLSKAFGGKVTKGNVTQAIESYISLEKQKESSLIHQSNNIKTTSTRYNSENENLVNIFKKFVSFMSKNSFSSNNYPRIEDTGDDDII